MMSMTGGARAMADMGAPQRQMTLGEYRVGITFNPGGNPKVDAIKRAAADLIDLIDSFEPQRNPTQDHPDGEVARLKALAMTHIEDGAMWAVKAVTKPVR